MAFFFENYLFSGWGPDENGEMVMAISDIIEGFYPRKNVREMRKELEETMEAVQNFEKVPDEKDTYIIRIKGTSVSKKIHKYELIGLLYRSMVLDETIKRELPQKKK